MNNHENWRSIFEYKKDLPLIFIHTPKCGGTYVGRILKDLNVLNKGHVQAIEGEGINFTVIRNPIERFESLINFRLNEKTPRNDWPKNLQPVHWNKNININEVVGMMGDNEILGFSPYRTLKYWAKNIDILITIDQLPEFLKSAGYSCNFSDYKRINVSSRSRGEFNKETRDRIEILYSEDILFFDKSINSA